MRKRELDQIKNLLIQQLSELLSRADCSLEGVGESNENLSDVLDRAAKIAELNFSHRLCSREKLLIRKIERSLQDIENGDYGLCQHCEENISVKRLKARPTARYCIDCKTQLETMERLTGVDAN
jgi:DnaK suppressor protein